MSQQRESARPTQDVGVNADARTSREPRGPVTNKDDVVIVGHDVVILDADATLEVARLGRDGGLDLVNQAKLDRFGLELFDLEQNSAVCFRTQSLQLERPTIERPTTASRTSSDGDLQQTVHRSDATLRVGTTGNEGHIELNDTADRRVIDVDGGTATLTVGTAGNGGDIVVLDGEGRDVVSLNSGTATVAVGAEGNEGDVVIRNHDGRDAIHLDGGSAALTVGVIGNEGDLAVLDGDGRDSLRVNGETATVTVGGPNRPGDLAVRDLFGNRSIWMTGADAVLRVGGEGQEGDLIVRDVVGRDVLHMNGENSILIVGAEGNEGDIIVRDETGADRIQLNGSTGDIKLLGADLAEDFDTATVISPGAVVVAVGPDEVAESTAPFDRGVVGVVSGAGNLQPALRLATRPDGRRTPIALVGRVYCQADAGPGSIEVGDLLTSSNMPGHAMRVGDPHGAAGTIIGKALGPLDAGTGLVPVLLMLR